MPPMATMQRRKTLTMNWDGLGDDEDDDRFFETYNRMSTAVPLDLASSSSDEDVDFEDSRLSFASNYSAMPSMKPRKSNYDIWMASPGSITERRRRLLGSMGLDENKELLQATSIALARAITNKFEKQKTKTNVAFHPNVNTNTNTTTNTNPNTHVKTKSNANVSFRVNVSSSPLPSPPHAVSRRASRSPSCYRYPVPPPPSVSTEQPQKPKHDSPVYVLVRSRSDGDIDTYSLEKSRKEEFIGKVSKQRLTRTATGIRLRARARHVERRRLVVIDGKETNRRQRKLTTSSSGVGAFFLIKNLDTGKEFIVNEYGENGMWNKLSDLQTGKQLTMEEFERTVGHSEVVKDIMRRANVTRGAAGKKLSSKSLISKSLRLSKRKSASLLKNMKGVASGIVGEREREGQQVQQAADPVPNPVPNPNPKPQEQGKNDWVKVRQVGKTQKDLSALHLCQAFEAHEGCIWTIKFSLDGRYLASAGEDRVIHVWEVQECEVMNMKPEEGNLTPIHPSLLSSMEKTDTSPLSNDKKKKGKNGSRRGSSIPDYVHVPETVFTFFEKPYCSFDGHLDEVLDLSWSKSQLLLSSSMDKTVRLWDVKTKACVKFFAHNDYVTCVQFNPKDDDYFISGSLDAKIRMWNIPSRLVVDWTDVHEMVTAISYTPDGQGVIVGTQKGCCRTYDIEDYKLSQTGSLELRNKKKSQLKKVTGFQFAPNNPSEVLVSSGDCRIRIIEGSTIVQKFIGFRNADSQIAASFSPNGKYIVSASEDSNVYVWKHDEPRNGNTGKARTLVVNQSYEQFPCRDVSVAICWPSAIKGDPPPEPSLNPKKNTPVPAPAPAPNGKKNLPPLPKKNNNNNAAENSPSSPPNDDPAAISRTKSGIGDSTGNSSKKMLPPAAHKKSKSKSQSSESIEEELEAITTDTGIGDSFGSGSSSTAYGDSPSVSATTTSNDGTSAMHSSAWGMVIVTAGFGGEIMCYQNFGLPRKMGNLFGGPT